MCHDPRLSRSIFAHAAACALALATLQFLPIIVLPMVFPSALALG